MGRLKESAINFKYAFRPCKPFLIWRLAKTLAKSYIFKRPPLRYVDLALDFDCNLKCQHCFALSLKQENRRKLTISEYRDIAEQCMKLGTVNFSFQGGEPLLLENLKDIIHAFRPHQNLISVTTNGTLLNGRRIEELKRMGVDILTVSLDSSIPDEHDSFRGVPGSFAKTVSGIRLALKKGLNVTLGCVVTHHTLRSEGIKGLVELAQGLKTVLYIILPVAVGGWAQREDVLLDEEDMRFIDGLTRRSSYVRTDFQANLGPYGCGAAKEILYITPYGDVFTCPFLHVSAGNVLNEAIKDIRGRALRDRHFAVYHDKCLASNDREFTSRYISKVRSAKALPLQWSALFGEDN